MSLAAPLQTSPATPERSSLATGGGPLQRKRASGSVKPPFAERCDVCQSPALQRKLTIGASNDRLEQEADRVADQVMAMPEHSAITNAPLHIQRLSEQPAGQSDVVPASVGRTLASPGTPMESALRQDMERRFGYDFTQVRIHSNAAAEQSTRDVSATAYTVGRNIVFGAGRYVPGTQEGRRLIAHELAHAVQQRFSRLRLQREELKRPCAVHAYDASDPEDKAIIPTDGSGIGVKNVTELVNKVNSYVDDQRNACRCVSRLEINGHGYAGNQSVGDGLRGIPGRRLRADSPDEIENLRKLASIKFCPFALFMMLGCHVGDGADGKTLIAELAKILPGKLIGGAKHFTSTVGGLGKTRVAGTGDPMGSPYSEKDPYLLSRHVRWHIIVNGKESIINGDETESADGKAKLKAAESIKVKSRGRVIRIK